MKTLFMVFALLVSTVLADSVTDLQNVSLTIHAAGSEGSGTIITRSKSNYVLTAGHVVASARKAVKITNNGAKSNAVRFEPVEVVREIYVSNRSVGRTSIQADVLAYSSARQDYLALLKLRSKICDDSVVFAPLDPPSLGTELYHVGSLVGQKGSNSLVTGIYSQVGRVLFDKVFDQTSCPAFPGSSGGGVFNTSTSQFVGVVVRAYGVGFNLIVPNRRVMELATRHGVEFIFDPAAPVDEKRIRLEGEELDESGDEDEIAFTHAAPTLLLRR